MNAARHALFATLPPPVRERLWATAVAASVTVDELVCAALDRPASKAAMLAARPLAPLVRELADSWPHACRVCGEDGGDSARCIFCRLPGCVACVDPAKGCPPCVAARAAEAQRRRSS